MSKEGKGDRVISVNKRAGFDYFIEEKFEAGMVLAGSEGKSLREGKMSIKEAYATIKNNELFLINSHIPTYQPAGQFNHEPKRARKLLLSRTQLDKLHGKLSRQGYTLIPMRCYFKKGKAKIEIGLARGKKKGDKRQSIKEAEIKREMRRYKS